MKAVEYVETAGVAEPNDYAGYKNLEKAKRLAHDVKAAYEVNVVAMKHMIENNELNFNLLNDVVASNLEIARSREDLMFSETGILSMGMGLLGFGGFTGLLGTLRKRPGDLTKQDYEAAVGAIKEEVTDKDRQIIELVKGVQEFCNYNGGGTELKRYLKSAQSADTKELIGKIKATL
jgi:hypothetical protein